ncbi:MAG TPA: succinate dehydrogenase, hydrophobic membrane anchor protein [Trueperaceae bacterium]|nr:succinate dehydrogenase, hydrophobic membrane anchor protein [Trueperaceae bacterium]
MAAETPTVRARRPRTLSEARATYATNNELAWWVFMRISGFLLVFLVFAHVFTNNILINAGTIDYDYVAERFAQPAVRVMDSFLLGLALLHGTNGLRYVVDDYFRRPQVRFWVKAVLYTVVVAVFVLGLMALWTFTFTEMGDAIRNLGQ